MTAYSIIKKSELEGATRLDAEYYQPEYLEIAAKLKDAQHKLLGDISESLVSFGAYALTNFIEWKESGVPFIVAENIKEGFVDYESARYIDDKTDEISRTHPRAEVSFLCPNIIPFQFSTSESGISEYTGIPPIVSEYLYS